MAAYFILTFVVPVAFDVFGAAFGADGVFAAGFEASFLASFTGPDGPKRMCQLYSSTQQTRTAITFWTREYAILFASGESFVDVVAECGIGRGA